MTASFLARSLHCTDSTEQLATVFDCMLRLRVDLPRWFYADWPCPNGADERALPK